MKKHCYIIPRAGLNDSLNQIEAGLQACLSLDLRPIIRLELNPDYETGFSELLVFRRDMVLDFSQARSIEGALSIEELEDTLADSRIPRNSVQFVRGQAVYLGAKGGLINAVRLLMKVELSPSMNEIFKAELKRTDLNTLAVNLRCGDVEPAPGEIEKVKKKAKRTNITVYSDCDPSLYLTGESFVKGFSGNTSRRSGLDLVSLFLMSRHDDLHLSKVVYSAASKKIFKYRVSNFGLLAFTMAFLEKSWWQLLHPRELRKSFRLLISSPGQFFSAVKVRISLGNSRN